MRLVRELLLSFFTAAVVLTCYILAASVALFSNYWLVPHRVETDALHHLKSGRAQFTQSNLSIGELR